MEKRDLDSTLAALEENVNAIRTRLENKPKRITLLQIDRKLDLILKILSKNGIGKSEWLLSILICNLFLVKNEYNIEYFLFFLSRVGSNCHSEVTCEVWYIKNDIQWSFERSPLCIRSYVKPFYLYIISSVKFTYVFTRTCYWSKFSVLNYSVNPRLILLLNFS